MVVSQCLGIELQDDLLAATTGQGWRFGSQEALRHQRQRIGPPGGAGLNRL